jgi:hypothetical protein
MKDKRYTVTREFTGASSARHVVRFCGARVGDAVRKTHAWTLAQRHADERDKVLRGMA